MTHKNWPERCVIIMSFRPLYAPSAQYVITHCMWRCVHRCHLWPWRRDKKERNFHASKWIFVKTTYVDKAPEIYMWGRVTPVVVIYFKYLENRLRELRGLKITISHWLGRRRWLIQQLALPYKP